jgi:hypothetical protein
MDMDMNMTINRIKAKLYHRLRIDNLDVWPLYRFKIDGLEKFASWSPELEIRGKPMVASLHWLIFDGCSSPPVLGQRILF